MFLRNYPEPCFRFGRIVRPLLMIPYSKDLRRTLLGIMKTSKDLVILFILYFLDFFCCLWNTNSILCVGITMKAINYAQRVDVQRNWNPNTYRLDAVMLSKKFILIAYNLYVFLIPEKLRHVQYTSTPIQTD